MQSWIFSIITWVFSFTIIQKSFWYADLVLKKHVVIIINAAKKLLNIFLENIIYLSGLFDQ